MLSNTDAELLLFENYSRSSSMSSTKNNRTYSEKLEKRTSESVFIRLILIKMKINMENRSYRYDINRPRSRHGHHKYSKYKEVSQYDDAYMY